STPPRIHTLSLHDALPIWGTRAYAHKHRFRSCESPTTKVPASFLPEHERPVAGVGLDPVAIGELTVEQAKRQLVLDLLLDEPLQRTRAVRGIEATLCQELPGLVGQR